MTYAPGSLWYYAPNKGAPIAFAVLFALSGIIHMYQLIRYKTFKTTFLLPWASILFVAGFALREVGAYNYKNEGIFIASTVVLLIAPPVYAGANYFILGRTLYYIPYNSPIHPGRVVSTFVGIDLVIGVLTGNGAANVANSSLSEKRHKLGGDLLKAALILQICSMLAFIGIAAWFHVRCVRGRVFNYKVRNVILTLYASCTLIFARSVFRTVEYFEATNGLGPLIRVEAYFWVFEVSLMFINTVVMNIWHPGRFMPTSNNTYLARDGLTEHEGPGWVDKRPFLATLVDPFDLMGLLKGKDKQHAAFWDEDHPVVNKLEASQPGHRV